MRVQRQSRPTHALVEGQAHLVKLSCQGAEAVGGGKRGRVQGFSRASRKRLLELLARLDPARTEFPVTLITLTYGREFPGPERAKRDLFTFCKRVERWWSGTSAIWRLEFQQRGAPHFHLIYFGPYLHKSLLQQWWGEVIGQERPFTRIEALRNWRHGIAYAAKYLAKVPEVPVQGAEADGTAAGGGGDAPAGGLDYVTYLTGEKRLGRLWGVIGRKYLPWGERQEVELPIGRGRWVHRWKRAARHEWRGVNRREFDGATLFRENPEPWLRLAVVQQGEERLTVREVTGRRAKGVVRPMLAGDEIASEAVRRARARRKCDPTGGT